MAEKKLKRVWDKQVKIAFAVVIAVVSANVMSPSAGGAALIASAVRIAVMAVMSVTVIASVVAVAFFAVLLCHFYLVEIFKRIG